MMAAIEKVKRLYVTLGDSRYDVPYLVALLLLEAVLCSAIVNFVPYTEIDWEAYMQEVDLWQGGELDYRKIRGGTGPLVYPAGFLYLYAWLSRITRTNQGNENGHDIRQAQIVFISLYVITTAFVLAIYTRVARRTRLNLASQIQTTSTTGSDTRMQRTNTNNVWSWRLAMGLCCLSKRIHSIFVLRLFNDGPAMLLLYLSMWFFTMASWRVGCFIFSLAVSIKMNILLFAPGLLLLLLQFPPHINETLVCLGICATVQLILGAPFLLSYPQSYIRKAFEFDRVFFYKWTVNWKFLSEDAFVSKTLSILLLLMHLSVLALLAWQWLRSTKLQTGRRLFLNESLTPEYVVYTLMVSNFVGICFARTLHYQFYVWYFHSVPFLLFGSPTYPLWIRVALIAATEYSFNVFPATPTSSAVLQMAHLIILAGLGSPRRVKMMICVQKDFDKGGKAL